MSGDIHEWEAYSPEDDVCDADLGDERRTKRYVSIVEALSHRPDASVPEAVEDESAQEGYYRFVRNPSIANEDLLEPHYEATRQRAERLDTVLCIHDTTRFAFPLQDDEMRDHLARLSSNRQGFQWPKSLVFSADRTRAPLGLAHTQPFVHLNDLEEDGAPEFWDERGGIYPDNEKWRWTEYTSLQHRSAKTLLAALAPSAIVAHHLLVLRHLSRRAEDLPARVAVTPVQLTVLQTEKSDDVPDEQPTVEDVMQGVARGADTSRRTGRPAGKSSDEDGNAWSKTATDSGSPCGLKRSDEP